jgi:ubiquitin C-terminal hydrolase
VQCLLNLPLLTGYFYNEVYREHVNSTSETKGKMARAYADLVKRVWRDGASGVERPSEVKAVVGKVASRFVGYDQQDAQEFLRFMLDALHEDTNTAKRPVPYEEMKESQTDSDLVVSEMWWNNYSLRNRSYLKQLFCGQLRTAVTCSVCRYVSRCFDPFWDLSVRRLRVASVPRDTRRRRWLCVCVCVCVCV